MKKDSPKSAKSSDLVEEARKTLVGAKDWLVEDVSLMTAYWHDKMGYTEAWVNANWHLVLDEGHELIEELDEKEDTALLWLINHANNNPVPLEQCHVVGSLVEAGTYHCMSCGHDNVLETQQALAPCEICHYGLMSTHQQ
ncbi:leucyl-tRNA synthetase [Marinomonas ushuaiensis DSM 15871]|uniref:Leucyl-tRNA synthetase n=1 Tax=Marinomonas ushuaiensis DSM 15871 TaxID=1122207 RepID=X7E7A2_9GAMM|nr:leucyl-tRNA synthetase [Marinomonas ushuaiensis]ETX11066.1 leucyl-tRNA synthetase [Marinomonas ushuaiensis DSM 15871]